MFSLTKCCLEKPRTKGELSAVVGRLMYSKLRQLWRGRAERATETQGHGLTGKTWPCLYIFAKKKKYEVEDIV